MRVIVPRKDKQIPKEIVTGISRREKGGGNRGRLIAQSVGMPCGHRW